VRRRAGEEVARDGVPSEDVRDFEETSRKWRGGLGVSTFVPLPVGSDGASANGAKSLGCSLRQAASTEVSAASLT
jgi:hypothetical protein